MMESNKGMINCEPQKIAYGVLITLGIITMLLIGKELLIPLILSIFIATLLNSVRATLQGITLLGYSLNKITATLLAIALVVLINTAVISLLASQAEAFKLYIPIYEQNLQSIIISTQVLLGIDTLPSLSTMSENIEISGILSWIGESLTIVFSNVFLTLMLTLFLMSEQGKLPEKLSKLTQSPEKSDNIRFLCRNISRSIQKYIVMKTFVSAITGILSYAVLAYFNVHFAAMWAFLIFLLNFIPNIGSIIGVLLPSLLTLLQFDTLTTFFIVTSLLACIQFIVGNIIEPAYFGKSLNLSSFVVLISMFFWGLIWGLVGMFLSIPLLVATSLICQHINNLQWISRLISSDGEFIQIQ